MVTENLPFKVETKLNIIGTRFSRGFPCVTKNCGVTCVPSKIRECANFVSNLLAYLISVASQCIFSCLRLLL